MADRHKVSLIQVDDILGCKELAEKMIDGRLGIGPYEYDAGKFEYRFLKEEKTDIKAA